MKINREDIVQAALMLMRFCMLHGCGDCPLFDEDKTCMAKEQPFKWGLEEKLRTRGLEHERD